MTISKPILIFACLYAAILSSHALDIVCPKALSESPSVQEVPDNWEAVAQAGQRPLEQVGLYIDHPKKRGSLVPDASRKTHKEELVTWKLVRGPQDEFWAGCTYYGTTAMLVRKLDAQVTRCVARYSLLPTRQRDTLIGLHCD